MGALEAQSFDSNSKHGKHSELGCLQRNKNFKIITIFYKCCIQGLYRENRRLYQETEAYIEKAKTSIEKTRIVSNNRGLCREFAIENLSTRPWKTEFIVFFKLFVR